MHEPRVLKEHRIKVGVNENRELVWLEGEEQIEPERLGRVLIKSVTSDFAVERTYADHPAMSLFDPLRKSSGRFFCGAQPSHSGMW